MEDYLQGYSNSDALPTIVIAMVYERFWYLFKAFGKHTIKLQERSSQVVEGQSGFLH